MKTTGCFGCPFFDTHEEKGDFWCVSHPSQIDNRPFCSIREEYIELLDECPEHWVRMTFRTRCNIPANLSAKGISQNIIISNISESGMFIKSELSQKAQRLEMSFTLPGEDSLLKVSGDIIRTEKNGLGVKFNNPEKKELELINKYIKEISTSALSH
jgi:hypothetical protein